MDRQKYKYPKGEKVWMNYFNLNGNLMFIVTSKTQLDAYFLYEFINGDLKKLGRAKSPFELEERFDVGTRLR